MKKHTRTLLVGVSAMIALGTLSACSGGSSNDAAKAESSSGTAPVSAAPFPQSGKFIADTEKDGKKMTIGISVDGDSITAYACNGVDDEAWFFGNQADGKIDVQNKFRDTLNASFDGTDVTGDLTMNGVTFDFDAAAAPAPAGMYTADYEGVRASWVLRPDGQAVGVQFNGGISGRDFEQAELQQLKDLQFQSQVRNKRLLQQASQLVRLQTGGFTSTINGHRVSPSIVTGTTRFG